MDTRQLRQKLDPLLRDYRHHERQAEEDAISLRKAERRLRTALRAQKIVQRVAEEVQTSAHRQIASVVTRCLHAVFGEDAYAFKILFKQSRGKTEAHLLFARDGLEVSPLDAAGGGVVDVASFALRLACLMLSTPRCRRFLALDEPWKHLSAEYRPYMRQLVEKLAEEMNVQFLIITHSEDFEMGKVVEL